MALSEFSDFSAPLSVGDIPAAVSGGAREGAAMNYAYGGLALTCGGVGLWMSIDLMMDTAAAKASSAKKGTPKGWLQKMLAAKAAPAAMTPTQQIASLQKFAKTEGASLDAIIAAVKGAQVSAASKSKKENTQAIILMVISILLILAGCAQLAYGAGVM